MTDTSLQIGAYEGVLINHLEMLYRPGERNLAMEFCRLLGWDVTETSQPSETGSTYIIVRPEPRDTNYVNNVFYLSEVRPAQVELEGELEKLRSKESGLDRALGEYVDKARTKPHGIPHCGIRYRSFSEVEEIVDRVRSEISSPGSLLGHRLSVDAIGPDDPRSLNGDLLQAFVYTDLMCSGLFLVGQLFELQGQKNG
jgi:hypothetical protein